MSHSALILVEGEQFRLRCSAHGAARPHKCLEKISTSTHSVLGEMQKGSSDLKINLLLVIRRQSVLSCGMVV